jgi:hypothetical protein
MYEELNTRLEPLWQKWAKKFAELFRLPPPELPPLREINHSIPLIDPNKQYLTRLPKCAAALFPQLKEKMQHYVNVGWWKLVHSKNAVPLLCIPKICAELKLCTVIDACERNANTVLNAMLLPNQDMIREAVASHKYISVINMTDAYEQMRIVPEDMPKTLFTSPLGTYVSNVLQQGNCNGPSSGQRLMTFVF